MFSPFTIFSKIDSVFFLDIFEQLGKSHSCAIRKEEDVAKEDHTQNRFAYNVRSGRETFCLADAMDRGAFMRASATPAVLSIEPPVKGKTPGCVEKRRKSIQATLIEKGSRFSTRGESPIRHRIALCEESSG